MSVPARPMAVGGLPTVAPFVRSSLGPPLNVNKMRPKGSGSLAMGSPLESPMEVIEDNDKAHTGKGRITVDISKLLHRRHIL